MATEHLVSDLPVPPGELLSETLDAMNLSQAELARRMGGRPPQAINEIVRGTKEITAETAIQLERVLGVPAHIWLGLEAEYRHAKARAEDRRRLASEAGLADKFPCQEMTRLGWLPRTKDPVSRVAALLDFFGVGSLHMVKEAEAAAFRVSRSHEAQPEALAAWLRRAEIEAQRIETKPFSESRLKMFLPELRRLTASPPPEFEPRVKDELAQCGVALVFLPHLPKTHAHGAARWLAPEKALVQLTLRGKWADIFWFSLFHELAHILLHGRREVFIEQDDGSADSSEREADTFARDHLIPEGSYRTFLLANPQPTRAAIVAFARAEGIHPGIVVGRLQHEKRLLHSAYNDLRTRYEWATN